MYSSYKRKTEQKVFDDESFSDICVCAFVCSCDSTMHTQNAYTSAIQFGLVYSI